MKCNHNGVEQTTDDRFDKCLKCGEIIPTIVHHISHNEFFRKHGCTKKEYVLQDMSKEEIAVVKGIADEIKDYLL